MIPFIIGLLIFSGTFLLLVEILVVPGFGIAGVAGAGSTILGILWAFLAMTAHDATLFILAVGLVSIIISWLAVKKMPVTWLGRIFVLDVTEDREHGFTASPDAANLVGKKGKAINPMRPVGDVIIDGKRYSATARDGYLPGGSVIIVESVSNTTIVVVEQAE